MYKRKEGFTLIAYEVFCAKRNFFGAYLICDGGHHKWPCLIFPWKKGLPDSPVMRFSEKLESVQKDIAGVFGILKVWFQFLNSLLSSASTGRH
jgi:hypothetical protein